MKDMKRIIAFSAFLLMLASLAGCSAVIPMQQEYAQGPGIIRNAGSMNPNEYARFHAEAIDRACDLTRLQYRKVYKAYWRESQEMHRHMESNGRDSRLDRAYIRQRGRLERKMSRILTPEQFEIWRRTEGRNRRPFWNGPRYH